MDQETHICKYCRAEVTQPDEECYMAPVKGQTAVQWLVEQLNRNVVDLEGYPNEAIALPIIEHARQMEKEQAIRFHIECMKAGLNKDAEKKWDEYYAPIVKSTAEKRYSETYENQNT